MSSTFDHIAPYYDALAFLVYGNNLKNAKRAFFHFIPNEGRMLLIGGGTGNILNELLTTHEELFVDFLDASKKMIAIAEKNLDPKFKHRVNFVLGNHHHIPWEKQYDVVTTFFVIDCLKQDEASVFGKEVRTQLRSDGVWLFADFFHTKNIFQNCLLWLMYRFFKIVAGISTGKLPDYDSLFRSLSLEEIKCRKFLGGFIQSKVYKRI